MTGPLDDTAGSAASISIGAWILHPAANRIERDGQSVHIEPKATTVLQLLAERAGETVSRQELLDGAWTGVVVSDDALTQVIIKLARHWGTVRETRNTFRQSRNGVTCWSHRLKHR